MTDNSLQNTQDNDWNACETGTIAGLSQSLRAQRLSEQLTKGAVGLTAFALFFAVGFLTVKSFVGESSYGGIVCSEVKANAAAYITGDLEQSIIDKIDLHLKECAHCREAIDHQRDERQAQAITVRLSTSIATTNRPHPSWNRHESGLSISQP